MVTHTFDFCTQDAETGGSLSCRPAWLHSMFQQVTETQSGGVGVYIPLLLPFKKNWFDGLNFNHCHKLYHVCVLCFCEVYILFSLLGTKACMC